MAIIRRIIKTFRLVTLGAALISANTASSQTVRIQNGLGEFGQGWMFRHAGNCYAALPEHVAGPLPKVTLMTSAPVESDQATVVKPFWPGIDLAVAILDRGPLFERCIAELTDLEPSTAARAAGRAHLLRLSPLGEEERVPIRVLDRDYLSFAGELVGDGDVIMQGTSGSFAFADGKPIGMAVTSDDPSRASFMRSEEIALNLGRYLSEQGRAFAPTAASHKSLPSDGLAIRDLRSSVAAVLPQYGVDNLLGVGAWVAEPNGRVELVFRVGERSATSVQRVMMTAPSEGAYAVPKAISIFIDASPSGSSFRFWTQGEMRPDGVFDTGPLAGRNARWVKVVIGSAWSSGAIALDRIVVE